MNEARGQHEDTPSPRTSRRTALLGSLGVAGAALAAGGFALLRMRSSVAQNDPPSPIRPDPEIAPEPENPQEPLPEFTRLPRSDSVDTVAERDLPEAAKLFLVSFTSVPAVLPNKTIAERWISIVEYKRMWYVPESTAAVVWLTVEEADDLAASPGINSIQSVTPEAIVSTGSQLRSLPVVVTIVGNPDAIAAQWQRRFADQTSVRVLVVEGEFPVGGVGEYPAPQQIAIESSPEMLPQVIQEIARSTQVSCINQGGIRMEFLCLPCGQG